MKRPLPLARTVLAVAIFAFMMFGPFYRQVLRGKSTVFRNWQMYSGYGLDVCRVDYRQRHADGHETKLDRYELLGHEPWYSAPKSVRRIEDEAGAKQMGRKLCKALGGDADVRLWLTCAKRSGWWNVTKGEENLCRAR